jgi:hypothetical protein
VKGESPANTEIEQVGQRDSQADRFSWGSIVESTHWMVLHRPVETNRALKELTAKLRYDFEQKPTGGKQLWEAHVFSWVFVLLFGLVGLLPSHHKL